ncbi:MAG: uracil phosphoribosyltransferase [bacterium]
MNTCVKNNVIVCNYPITNQNLTVLRDKNTSSELFRNATKRIAQILFFKASENLPLVDTEIETPLTKTISKIIDPDSEVVIAPILRAGLIFADAASEIIPTARVHHIGLYRDEKTLQPVSYYNNLPQSFKNPDKTYIYILDPMLATGGSAVAAIKLFIDLKVPEENIRFVSLIAVNEGISKVQHCYPNVKIVTACIDEQLNENGYIVPGLGDAGDRTYNSIY